jgi:uncharacterized protein (DUF1330 family)
LTTRPGSKPEKQIVAAYWINTFTEIRDEERLRRYIPLAGAAMEAAGGRFLARGLPVHALEGASVLRTTLIEFGTVAAALAAYQGAPYQRALHVLGDAARREIRIMDGAR